MQSDKDDYNNAMLTDCSLYCYSVCVITVTAAAQYRLQSIGDNTS